MDGEAIVSDRHLGSLSRHHCSPDGRMLPDSWPVLRLERVNPLIFIISYDLLFARFEAWDVRGFTTLLKPCIISISWGAV